MTPDELKAWQKRQGYTYESAAEALGISRSGYQKLAGGAHPIDRRTALACAAIEAGIKPLGTQSEPATEPAMSS